MVLCATLVLSIYTRVQGSAMTSGDEQPCVLEYPEALNAERYSPSGFVTDCGKCVNVGDPYEVEIDGVRFMKQERESAKNEVQLYTCRVKAGDRCVATSANPNYQKPACTDILTRINTNN